MSGHLTGKQRHRRILWMRAIVFCVLVCLLIVLIVLGVTKVWNDPGEKAASADASEVLTESSEESESSEPIESSESADSSGSSESSKSIESSESYKPSESYESSEPAESSEQPESSEPAESTKPSESSEEEITWYEDALGRYRYIDPDACDWNLILVNKQNRLAENLNVHTAWYGEEEVDERIYEALRQMLEDGERNSDRRFLVCSGYRTVDLQTYLFERFLGIIKEESPSLTPDEAYLRAASEVAYPGASEHNTGLAVDICAVDFQLLEREFENTSEAKWLKAHCAEYGFILRYPDGREDITGYVYEPWHFRYVGKDAAAEIMERGITLEEYLAERNLP